MTDNERNIYLTIFDITENNLKKAGKDMFTYKETFNASLEMTTSSADIALLNDIPADRFVQALDYVFFYRWATDEDEEISRKSSLSDEDFKKEIIKKAYDSTERVTARRIVSNNIDCSENGNRKIGGVKRLLIKIYAGLKAAVPLSVKVKLKRMLK